MSKKALSKNVDASVAGYVSAIETEIHEQIKVLQDLMADQNKQAASMKESISVLQGFSESTDNSIASIEMKAKTLIDKALKSQTSGNEEWKDEVSSITGNLIAQVETFEKRMDDLEYKMKRYFDKEKYAITKGIITQIINEEKVNG